MTCQSYRTRVEKTKAIDVPPTVRRGDKSRTPLDVIALRMRIDFSMCDT